jgi:hypothetical protein
MVKALIVVAVGILQCSKLCEKKRDLIANNFGVQLDCSDPKWAVDCERCYAIFRTEFMIDPGSCEAL